MPKCKICYYFYPPQYMRDIENAPETDKQCIFCQRGKDYVMVMKEEGKEIKYTKNECIKDYKDFVKKLKETPNIAEKLVKNK